MENIRIEEVGDINFEYPYLEVFIKDFTEPFLEIGISEDKELLFKLYPSKNNLYLNMVEWNNILIAANDFLFKSIKNKIDFDNYEDLLQS